MAHQLEMNKNGEAMMTYAGETPWHGLGKEVPNDLSPEQMLRTAGLDWTVENIQPSLQRIKSNFRLKNTLLFDLLIILCLMLFRLIGNQFKIMRLLNSSLNMSMLGIWK